MTIMATSQTNEYHAKQVDRHVEIFEAITMLPTRSEGMQLALRRVVREMDLDPNTQESWLSILESTWLYDYCTRCGENPAARTRFAECAECSTVLEADEPEPQFDTWAEHRGER